MHDVLANTVGNTYLWRDREIVVGSERGCERLVEIIVSLPCFGLYLKSVYVIVLR